MSYPVGIDIYKLGIQYVQTSDWMEFFRTGLTSSPSNRRRADTDPETAQEEDNQDRNQFSYYFMLRTGKVLDMTISQQTKNFIFRTRGSKEDINVRSKEVQMFYTYMSKKLRSFHAFENWKPDSVDDVVIGMERFVMVNIYANVFNPPADRAKNDAIDQQIRSLHWILPKHLDFTLPNDNENSDRQLALAQYYLLQLNEKRSPHDKIACIALCCKALHELFSLAHDKAAGADELMPMLIYTIIVAQPVNLYATTQYIDRFLPAETLSSGETAYNFTNICCALSFLENISPDKLSLSVEEFDHFMKGHSSHLEEALSTKFASGLIDNINRVKECEEKVRQLQSYHDKLRENTEQLQDDITKHKAQVQDSLSNMRNKFSCIEEEMAKLLCSWWSREMGW